MIHRVVGDGCEHSFASEMATRQDGEREAAAQMQLLIERGGAATPAPLGAEAEPRQCPVEPHGRLPATGGDMMSPSSKPATESRAVTCCQGFLDSCMEGN